MTVTTTATNAAITASASNPPPAAARPCGGTKETPRSTKRTRRFLLSQSESIQIVNGPSLASRTRMWERN